MRGLLLLALSACAGPGRAPAPAWFSAPPKAPDSLSFAGDASDAPDETTARELAVQKAFSELSLYVGAKLRSSASVEQREVNGVLQTDVSATLDLEGEPIEIAEARVTRVEVKPGPRGFDGWALVEWPRAQYDAVLASRKNRAERALGIYREAERAAETSELALAADKLGEAEELVGKSVSNVSLGDAAIKDTAVLRTAMATLRERIAAVAAERKAVCAVGVRCMKEGAAVACEERAGAVRAMITKLGKKVSATPPSAATLDAILGAGAPELDPSVRGTGCVVAVQFTATLMENAKPFVFIRYGARGVIFDPETRRVRHSHEIAPTKMGHVNFEGAMKKGFDLAQATMLGEIGRALGGP